MNVDAIPANVFNLQNVLRRIKDITGKTPFTELKLQIGEEIVPMALIKFGGITLEFLEHAKEVNFDVSRVSRVILEDPETTLEQLYELEPEVILEIRPGKKAKVVEIQVHTYDVAEDCRFLQTCCGAKKTISLDGEGTLLVFDNTRVRLFALEGESNYNLEDIGNPEIQIEHQPGWRRIAVACSDLDKIYTLMIENGARTILAPTKIIPGIREAMVVTSSGLVIQPVKQQLWKLIPYMGLRWVKSKIFRISD